MEMGEARVEAAEAYIEVVEAYMGVRGEAPITVITGTLS